MKSIKFWIVVFINLLIALTVSILLVFFYKEFQNALNERVLLQLSSIKNLKRVQIEEYINNEWQLFTNEITQSPIDSNYNIMLSDVDSVCFKNTILATTVESGVFDVSACGRGEKILLAFVKKLDNGKINYKIIDASRIQKILLERTGMGESGETYLVGKDFQLRSVSRFFPDSLPSQIKANTIGVQQAFSTKDSTGIFEDYRTVSVFSSFGKISISNINWAILSEIDVAEANIPLHRMKNKLIIISILVILLAVTLSLFISSVLSSPLLKMRDFLNHMSKGNYNLKVKKSYPAIEINEMFIALNRLKNSMKEAINFSSEIGQMNLNASYQLSSEDDKLGKSLIVMQEKLIEYESISKQNRLNAKQSIISGQEKERKRLARELHDGLGPLLTSLKMIVQSYELPKQEKEKINTIVNKTIDEIRKMTYDLMPPSLEDFGVGKALLNFVELMKKSSGVEIIYNYDLKEDKIQSNAEIDICLFRICQELINNTLKHANASKIVVSLTEFDEKFSLYYTDNGSGFNTNEIKSGLGLRNIKERVEIFDGYLNITSENTGIEVEVEIPINYDKNSNSR
ncbi:histidine kinase [Chondrinema litorale]|uniref:ATP-binding protein n=1 Tax=Chondrinema litorale TaxID=2994555 RepID=UPI0025427BA1|nr:histidine kinase [Chondrinema litorale]UZR96479.1 histidine kinase [Chondrinema litorale]